MPTCAGDTESRVSPRRSYSIDRSPGAGSLGSPASQRKDLGRSESLRVVCRPHRIFRPSDLIHGEVLGKGCFGQAIKVQGRARGGLGGRPGKTHQSHLQKSTVEGEPGFQTPWPALSSTWTSLSYLEGGGPLQRDPELYVEDGGRRWGWDGNPGPPRRRPSWGPVLSLRPTPHGPHAAHPFTRCPNRDTCPSLALRSPACH